MRKVLSLSRTSVVVVTTPINKLVTKLPQQCF